MRAILQKINNWVDRSARSIFLIMLLVFPCLSLCSGSRMPTEYEVIHKDVVTYKKQVKTIEGQIRLLDAQIRYKDSIDLVNSSKNITTFVK